MTYMKGMIKMETIEDYISLVASGMGITLNDEQTEAIAQMLIKNDNYKKMLAELEEMIRRADRNP